MDGRIENTIEYWIYPFKNTDFNDILAFILDNSSVYIWHNETFKLTEKDLPVRHFYGSTNYGDNVDDEWFIVNLLLQLSVKYSDLVIRVQDEDGDFMLIEAADFLPRWMHSSTVNMRNRMFIHNGALHVIPRHKKYKNETEVNSIDFPECVKSSYDGASIVYDNPHLTVADSSLQLCIERKVGDLVDHLAEKCFHHAHCYLPSKAAFVLTKNPKLISSAVQAFYLRLPTDMQFVREYKHFPPKDLVKRRVKFTKHLYAMLAQQKFSPDRRSEWKLPSPDDLEYNNHLLGVKLTAGLEILARRSEKLSSDNQSTRTMIDHCSNWLRFKDHLSSKDYFEGELEGSARYNELLLAAQSFYQENFGQNFQNEPGFVVLSILEQFEPTFIEVAKCDSRLLKPADDDAWLNVTPAMLDEILDEKSNDLSKEISKEFTARDDIRKKVENFIKNESSYKGASSQSKNQAVNKNLMLHLPIPESSSESSDMDSYGSDESDNEQIDPSELEEMKQFGAMMKDYMQQMDAELGKTTIGKTFLRKKQKTVKVDVDPASSENPALSPDANSIDMEDDDFQPVDVDKNLIHGMLASYKHEKGLPGPASTLLHGLNILPSKINAAKLDSDDDSEADNDRLY